MRENAPQYDVLLVAADLEERRLLLAELQEAGYQVMPAWGLADAVQRLLLGRVAPRLILLDVRDDARATPEQVAELRAQAPDSPLILVVGAADRSPWEVLRPRATALLRRPISVGAVVDVLRRILPTQTPRERS